MEKMIRRKK